MTADNANAYDIVIVGAGPAGLAAAIETAKRGARPIRRRGISSAHRPGTTPRAWPSPAAISG